MPRSVSSPPKRKRGANAAGQAQTLRQLRAEKLNATNAQLATLGDPNKALTEKARTFVRLWASGETILSASYKAGYADNGTYAYRIARLPHVVAEYEREKKAYEEASQMTRKRVMDGLLEAIEMAKMMSEAGNMIAGWREVAKMCGYYAPVEKKITVDSTGNAIAERLNRLSDAELLRLIQQQPDVVDVPFTEVSSGQDAEDDAEDDAA